MIEKIKNTKFLLTTIIGLLVSIVGFSIKMYISYEHLINVTKTNQQMSLKSVIWNKDIPVGEQLSACDIYISNGYNSLTKRHCEEIINNYNL